MLGLLARQTTPSAEITEWEGAGEAWGGQTYQPHR